LNGYNVLLQCGWVLAYCILTCHLVFKYYNRNGCLLEVCIITFAGIVKQGLNLRESISSRACTCTAEQLQSSLKNNLDIYKPTEKWIDD